MPRPAKDIVVVGAGAFGLSTALRLARAGLRVRVLDRETEPAANASAVAAGMLAPVGETLAEGGGPEHLHRLLAARDLWPDFARAVPGLELDRTGADLVCASPEARDAMIVLLSRGGMDFSRLPPPALGVRVTDDWTLDPATALAAMRGALQGHGVAVRRAVVSPLPGGGLAVDGQALEAEAVVLAAGVGGRSLAEVAPELAVLTPVKGQLVTFAAGNARRGRVLRGEGVYLVPQPSGARAGATMQPGCDDCEVDPAVTQSQRDAALRLRPELAGLAFRGEAGVRAATPDGWPLVGPSATPGVFLAAGARRNGWLLAPLVSRIILDAVTGAAPHPLAQPFHPGRFTR